MIKPDKANLWLWMLGIQMFPHLVELLKEVFLSMAAINDV